MKNSCARGHGSRGSAQAQSERAGAPMAVWSDAPEVNQGKLPASGGLRKTAEAAVGSLNQSQATCEIGPQWTLEVVTVGYGHARN